MTDNAKKILEYLKDSGMGEKFTIKQLYQTLGVSCGAVSGTLNSLEKKNYVEKFKEEVEKEDGTTSTVTYYCLNEAGFGYKPE